MTQTPGIHRWIAFNLVGAAGVVVQLAALAALTRLAALDVLPATALAVELAVLHNFVWHQRWTWGDRPARGARAVVVRLARFHALNGLVSLAGNVAITMWLVRTAALDPVVANAIAIAACSLVNYAAGDLLVFRTPALIVVLLTGGTAAHLAAQPAAALEGWTRYVARVDQRLADTTAGFFALDMRQVPRWRERARAGEIPMAEVDPPGVPDGKLHHWTGAVFVGNTSVDAVVRRIQEHAGREAEFYEEVKGSKLLDRRGDTVRVFMRIYRDAGPVDVTYNTEHLVQYRRLDGTRTTSRSEATKIAELADPGTPREREKPPGDDSGFLWRLNAYWRYEQWGDGVLIECESVSLSRSVPFIIRPIANPIVNRIARESLERTLRSLRKFLATR
ncbi:MAG TPA: GtrA family protein [Vicinamibacterales bacterium]|nr:GtrA family protein [Vicinamibacterales bacterium]